MVYLQKSSLLDAIQKDFGNALDATEANLTDQLKQLQHFFCQDKNKGECLIGFDHSPHNTSADICLRSRGHEFQNKDVFFLNHSKTKNESLPIVVSHVYSLYGLFRTVAPPLSFNVSQPPPRPPPLITRFYFPRRGLELTKPPFVKRPIIN